MGSWFGLLALSSNASHTPPPWRSRIVTMVVPSTMEPANVLSLPCLTSSLRRTIGLLTTGHQRNGDAELPPPLRRHALSRPRHFSSLICYTMLGSTVDLNCNEEILDDHKVASSAHYQQATDTVRVGVQSQRSEDVVATEGSTRYEIGFKVLAVAFSPDGRLVASGSVDKTSDSETPALERQLFGQCQGSHLAQYLSTWTFFRRGTVLLGTNVA
jgi:WD40 repeat protein